MVALWRADQLIQPAAMPPGSASKPGLGEGLGAFIPSGFSALDQALPGGGWPRAGLVECLQPAFGAAEWALWAPALVQLRAHDPSIHRPVLCIAPPQPTRSTRPEVDMLPFTPALQSQGLDATKLIHVTPANVADAAWVAEQALRSQACAAVFWWEPNAISPTALSPVLRRLNLAAMESATLAVVFRAGDDGRLGPSGAGLSALRQPTPAPLRVHVMRADDSPNALRVLLLKRRGPPMTEPLVLTAPVLQAQALQRWRNGAGIARKGDHAVVRLAPAVVAA